jgi:mRNA interferase MazF
MKEGDIVLTPVPQADGNIKNRPVLLLRRMPGFGDFLACGISSQLHQLIEGFDEIISSEDTDFKKSGLLAKSLLRLGFLALLPNKRIMGTIGSISSDRHQRLLNRLSQYLIDEVI